MLLKRHFKGVKLKYTSLYDLFIHGVDMNDDIYFLKLFHAYSSEIIPIPFTYSHSPDLYLKIQKLYDDFPNKSSCRSEMAFFIQVRKWVNRKLFYANVPPLENYDKASWNSLYVLEKISKNPFARDCGTYSMVLAELLLSLGFRARWVCCLPMDLRYCDSHAVVQVYSNEFNKWIILDPALDCCYFDSKGIPLSLSEFRNAIINESRMLIPGHAFGDRTILIKYWSKNIFRFCCYIDNKVGFISEKKIHKLVYLHPVRFCIEDKKYIDEEHIYVYSDKSYWGNLVWRRAFA